MHPNVLSLSVFWSLGDAFLFLEPLHSELLTCNVKISTCTVEISACEVKLSSCFDEIWSWNV